LPQVYSTAVPEQHEEGFFVSVSGPTQVQMPPLHVPEMHSTLDVHVAPLARCCAHVPSSQNAEVQLSLAAQGEPSGSDAVHVPALHHLDVQSASPEHAEPSGWGPHLPFTQRFAAQSAGRVHGEPSGRGKLQAPW
jgi:hypothetical protein